jgi:hypothetical protein
VTDMARLKIVQSWKHWQEMTTKSVISKELRGDL